MAQNGVAERSNAAVHNDQGGTMCPAAHAASVDYASTLADADFGKSKKTFLENLQNPSGLVGILTNPTSPLG